MRHTRYYIIRPDQEFLEKHKTYFDLYEQDLRFGGFTKPSIWSFHIANRVRVRVPRMPRLKIMFLADLYSDFVLDCTASVLINFVKEILGEPPYTAEIFDQWWTIEELTYQNDVYDIEKYIEPEVLQQFQVNDDPVLSQWLESLIIRRSDSTMSKNPPKKPRRRLPSR